MLKNAPGHQQNSMLLFWKEINSVPLPSQPISRSWFGTRHGMPSMWHAACRVPCYHGTSDCQKGGATVVGIASTRHTALGYCRVQGPRTEQHDEHGQHDLHSPLGRAEAAGALAVGEGVPHALVLSHHPLRAALARHLSGPLLVKGALCSTPRMSPIHAHAHCPGQERTKSIGSTCIKQRIPSSSCHAPAKAALEEPDQGLSSTARLLLLGKCTLVHILTQAFRRRAQGQNHSMVHWFVQHAPGSASSLHTKHWLGIPWSAPEGPLACPVASGIRPFSLGSHPRPALMSS